jgi:DNA-binding NarL/FixJ family response regulator
MKILLVDDHALFRDGLALVLGRLTDAPTLLHAETALQGIELAGKELNLDLVLLDLGLPDANGLDTLAALRRIAPATPVVIVSASHGRDEIERALSLGA